MQKSLYHQNQYHLANIDIGTMRGIIESPIMADFRKQIKYFNELADNSPGFVWRLQTKEGDTTSIHAFNSKLIFITLSVWDSIESIKKFAYSGDHAEILKQRKRWFLQHQVANLALWWVPAGHVPTVEEAKERLAYLDKHGPTPFAFNFRALFDPHGNNMSRSDKCQ